MNNPNSIYDKRLLNLKSCSFLNAYRRNDMSAVASSLIDKVGTAITTDPSHWNLKNTEYSKIYDLWKSANFNVDAIKWTNYYPDKDFSSDLVNDIAFYLRANGVHRSWISRIDPGYYAPWHWDVDDNEDEYLKHNEIKRYSIMMNSNVSGHIFMLGQDYLYNLPCGSIFKWNNYKDWHSGINAGMTPKFMFHLLAY